MATDISTNAIHGRDDLLAHAERRIADVREGQGHLLLLSGEAGIGKTRLLQAVHAAGRRVHALGGGCLPPGHRAVGGAAARSRVRDVTLGGCRRGRPGPRPGERPRRDHRAVDDPGDAHRRRRLLVLEAAERLASLAADGPALLALEDLHWCDELSLEVVGHLARRLPSLPLLVVGTLRTDELHQETPVRAWRSRMLLQRLAEEARLPRLDLDAHHPDGAGAAPVEPSLPALVGPRPRAVGRRATARRGARERRRAGAPGRRPALRARTASPRRSSNASGCSPRPARSAPSRPPSYAAASTSSCWRRWPACRWRMRPRSLDELIDRHFVHEESPGWFGYRHALIRDAIEAAAPLARRRALHARVAEEARTRVELGGDAYRSAHHEEAGQLAEASVVGGDGGRAGLRAVRAPGGARAAASGGALPR